MCGFSELVGGWMGGGGDGTGGGRIGSRWARGVG